MLPKFEDISLGRPSVEKITAPDSIDHLEIYNLERDKKREELKNLQSDRDLREKYAGRVWWFLVVYSITVVILLLMSGFSIRGSTILALPDAVLVTLAGSTAVAAIGLVGIIAKGLFNQEK